MTTLVLLLIEDINDTHWGISMRYINIEEAKPGDIVAKSIYGLDRRPLITDGMVLTDRYIERLKEFGVYGLYIVDPDLEGVEIEQGLDEQFKLEAMDRLQKIFAEVQKNNRIPAKAAVNLANEITDLILAKRDFIVQLKDIRFKQTYLYSHSINVTMLAVLTAKGLGYNLINIKKVAVGALLHDIGYMRTADPSAHPLAGFEILRREDEIPLLSSHIVLQHHEAIDGSGSPFKISGDQVRDAAQICAVCNDYDHLVNAVEDAKLPHESIEYVMAQADHKYRVDIVRAFVHNIAPYPIGTSVKLSNGQEGKVVHVHHGLPMRPMVRLKNGDVLDLQDEKTLFVAEVLKTQELKI